MSIYHIMNKDEILMDLEVSRNEYDEVSVNPVCVYTDLSSIGFRNAVSFIEGRRAPKHRAHISELLARYDCDDIEGFIRVTHALSLNDTIWIKEEGSALCWKDVSLYDNDFDEVISNTAFDGEVLSVSFSPTSPEFGTDGSFAKCWIRENEEIKLVKRGSSIFEIEPVSEFLCCQLAQYIVPEHVNYELDFYHGKLVSKCRLFTDENHGFLCARKVFGHRPEVKELLDFYSALGYEDYFRRMCVFDALTANTDRHWGNFGFIIDNHCFEILNPAPVFDNNMALFPQLDDDEVQNIDAYLRRYRPKIGGDFIKTAKALITDEIRNDLRNLRGFSFNQHERIKISEERLNALSSFMNQQIDRILN
ncbi:MAG: HipA protein [Clostridia bacterium]|nr:HipA protein [Clostridia bacterium]